MTTAAPGGEDRLHIAREVHCVRGKRRQHNPRQRTRCEVKKTDQAALSQTQKRCPSLACQSITGRLFAI
jgi:hypothetical protein